MNEFFESIKTELEQKVSYKRTQVQNLSNFIKNDFFNSNKNNIEESIWSSTLDSINQKDYEQALKNLSSSYFEISQSKADYNFWDDKADREYVDKRMSDLTNEITSHVNDEIESKYEDIHDRIDQMKNNLESIHLHLDQNIVAIKKELSKIKKMYDKNNTNQESNKMLPLFHGILPQQQIHIHKTKKHKGFNPIVLAPKFDKKMPYHAPAKDKTLPFKPILDDVCVCGSKVTKV